MRTRVLLIGLCLCGLTCVTQGRVRVFQNDRALWADAHATAPTKPRPMLNYGRELELAGDLAGAEALYREVITQAWDPRRPPYMRLSSQAAAETNIAHLRIKEGRLASAGEILTWTLSYWPIYPYALYNKATIFWMIGECDEGAHAYDRAVTIDPSLTLPKTPCVPKAGTP